MSTTVSDVSGNRNDKIANAAKVLGRAPQRTLVFIKLYSGKKMKTVSEIMELTKLSQVRVLQETKKLVAEDLISEVPGKTKEKTFEKINFYNLHKNKIISLAKNKKKLDVFPTKVNPRGNGAQSIILKITKQRAGVSQITIDHISSFSKVKSKKGYISLSRIPEEKMKRGLMRILNETGKPPKDWGGEKNDLFTTKLKIGAVRFHAAFALKGPGKKVKKLSSKDMGKNGDQIQRLLRSSAQVVFVQYWREIDQSVVDLMNDLAIGKSFSEGRTIYFGIINAEDSSRLIQAYPKAFK